MTRSQFGCVRRLDEGRYRVYWSEGVGDDGKAVRRSKVVRGSRRDAEMFLAARALDAGNAELYADSMTLEEFWAMEYARDIERLAPQTQDSYRRVWERHVRPLFGSDDMGATRARDIERRLLTLPSPGAQVNAYKLLRQMYNRAYDIELIRENPMSRRIRIDKQRKREPEVYTAAELPAVLEAVEGDFVEPFVILGLMAGLRREESTGLRVGDFSFRDEETVTGKRKAAYIAIQRTAQLIGGEVVVGKTKTDRSERTVVVVGRCAERLETYVSRCSDWLNERDGSCGDPERVAQRWKRLCARKGIRYVPMKNLRTTYSTIQAQIGTPDTLVSMMMGHAQLGTRYRHYMGANVDGAVAAAVSMDRMAN